MGMMGGGGGGGSGGTNQRLYSVNANDYKLLEEVGYGASATVYRAIYIPFNEVVAVKCLDLDCCNSNLDDIRREAQTMSLIDHPNVIMAYCSFVVDRNLWVLMPFMAEGSCLHLMKIAYPDGFDEPAICAILKETLKALEYLHRQGHIHRDVKAGNILLDSNRVVKLADFGVSACMFDTGERQRSRNTFVGTPCWMAPEVLQPGSGYDSKADIWSFGITALELAHGHAPFSKYPPMKVLLMTMQNAPPGLDYDRDKKFSKLFKEMVSMCLVKDQTKRPTSEKLLKHSFFKQAKPPEVSVKKLFADLPPLWNRVKALQLKDAAQLALKRMPSVEQEALSQSEYQRGVSAWNFDIEDLKAQASLISDDDGDDDDDISESKEDDEFMRTSSTSVDCKDPIYHRSSLGKGDASEIVPDQSEGHEEIGLSSPGFSSQKNTAFPSVLAEASWDEKLSCRKNGMINETMASTSEGDSRSKTKIPIAKFRQTHSGPLVPNVVLGHPQLERSRNLERDESEAGQLAEKTKFDVRKPSFSGPLMLPKRASANSLSAPIKSSGGFRDSLDDKLKANLVQIKGRFSVTSENLDLAKDIPLGAVPRRSSQGSRLRKSASVGDWIFESKQTPGTPTKEHNNSSFSASVVPHLQNLFQQTTLQQELIASLLNSMLVAEVNAAQNGKFPPLPCASEITESNDSAASQRERLQLLKIEELHARMISLTDELNEEKLKYKRLQQQLNALSSQENGYRGEMSRSCSNMCIS